MEGLLPIVIRGFSVVYEFSKCFTTDVIVIDAAFSPHNTGGGFRGRRVLKVMFLFVIIAAATAFITGCPATSPTGTETNPSQTTMIVFRNNRNNSRCYCFLYVRFTMPNRLLSLSSPSSTGIVRRADMNTPLGTRNYYYFQESQ